VVAAAAAAAAATAAAWLGLVTPSAAAGYN